MRDCITSRLTTDVNDLTLYSFNDNDNDKRLGLTAQADQPDHKKYTSLKIKIDNKAVQKLHTIQ